MSPKTEDCRDTVLPVRVVLVGPRGGANVGAVCRAMKNMGADELVTVTAAFDREEARRMAVHADDVLADCRDAASLAEAVAGCGLVVGTTTRRGAFRERAVEFADVAVEIAAACEGHAFLPTALVFGSEDSGLSNSDVVRCHRLAYVATAAAYPSLNLAQAVLICLYELRRQRMATVHGQEAAAGLLRATADAASVEQALESLQEALVAIGFLSERGSEHVMAAIRELLCRRAMDEREVRIVRGMARQILWFGRGGDEVARRKRARGEKLR